MTRYERIKELCKERGETITGLERKLGFAKGSLSKIDKNKPSYERLEKLAGHFEMPIEFFASDDVPTSGHQKEYYLDEKTIRIAQMIHENKELQLLFDDAKDADPSDLQAAHGILLALKRKERGID